MKKFKKLHLVILLVVLALVVPSSYYGIAMTLEVRKMHPAETSQIEADFYAASQENFVTAYFVKGETGYIAIDTGQSPSAIEKQMKQIGIQAEEVKNVLLTHSDSDHTGGAALFKNAVFYLGNQEVQMIDGSTVRAMGFFHNKFEYAYTTLDNREQMTIDGVKIECIWTPGHTPGHMAYLLNAKYLLTGDTLSINGGKIETFNDFFNMDTATEATTVTALNQEIKDRQIQYIGTAHYGVHRVDALDLE